MNEPVGVRKGLSRRDLLVGAAGIAVLASIGGGARLAFGSEVPLRPPGGQDERDFIAKCIKCDRCRSACHLGAIGVSSVNEGLLNARTPKMEFRKGYCDFCKDAFGHTEVSGPDGGLLCVANCPTGALKPFDHATEWISPAVVDSAECVAFFTRGACGVCVPACPFEAISLDDGLRPVVDESLCNGCGYCEYICPSHSYRAYSGSSKRGINVERTDATRPAHDGAEGTNAASVSPARVSVESVEDVQDAQDVSAVAFLRGNQSRAKLAVEL